MAEVTKKRFLDAWHLLRGGVEAWEKSDIDLIGGVKPITEGLASAIEKAVNMTADEIDGKSVGIAPDAMGDALAWDILAAKYREFKMRAVNGEPVSPGGDGSFWGGLRAVQDYYNNQPNFPLPPAIKTLRAEGVNDGQIATMYGWARPDGSPDTDKVHEELEAPGTHFSAKTWVHPAKSKRIAFFVREAAGRSPRRKEYDEPDTWGTTAPPSVEELLGLGAPPEQIARLHSMDITEAILMVQEFGEKIETALQPANSVVAVEESRRKALKS